MKWLSQKQIKEAAAKSPEAAHDCVIEHWTQLATCTFRELVWAVRNHRVETDWEHCAFCVKYQIVCKGKLRCRFCPIHKKTKEGICDKTPWLNAALAFGVFRSERTQANFDLFHKAAKKELKFLKTLRA